MMCIFSLVLTFFKNLIRLVDLHSVPEIRNLQLESVPGSCPAITVGAI
jgi:hypothetical protein